MSNEPQLQRFNVAHKMKSTLPFFWGNSFAEAAFNAQKNYCGVWRPFEVQALRRIANNDIVGMKRGAEEFTWHVCVENGKHILTFLFVKETFKGKSGYHIVYEAWHVRLNPKWKDRKKE